MSLDILEEGGRDQRRHNISRLNFSFKCYSVSVLHCNCLINMHVQIKHADPHRAFYYFPRLSPNALTYYISDSCRLQWNHISSHGSPHNTNNNHKNTFEINHQKLFCPQNTCRLRLITKNSFPSIRDAKERAADQHA